MYSPGSEIVVVTEKLLKALDTPMTVDYQDKPITEIFKEMEKIVPGLSIQVQIPAPDEDDFRRLTLKGQFSMRAVLALMEDTFSVRMNPEPQTRYTFAVREYGLLFAPNDRIPREAIRLHDLQKEIPPPKEEKKQDMQRK